MPSKILFLFKIVHSGLPPPTRPLTQYIFRRSQFQVLPFIFLLKSSCVTKDVLKCLPFRNILANVLDALKLGDVIAKNCSYVCTTLWLQQKRGEGRDLESPRNASSRNRVSKKLSAFISSLWVASQLPSPNYTWNLKVNLVQNSIS